MNHQTAQRAALSKVAQGSFNPLLLFPSELDLATAKAVRPDGDLAPLPERAARETLVSWPTETAVSQPARVRRSRWRLAMLPALVAAAISLYIVAHNARTGMGSVAVGPAVSAPEQPAAEDTAGTVAGRASAPPSTAPSVVVHKAVVLKPTVPVTGSESGRETAPSTVREPPMAAPLQPSAPQPSLGTLIIESNPSGAVVSIDRKPAGETPLQLSELPTGSHAVWIEREGYVRWTAGVLVPFGKVTRIQVELQPRPGP